MKSSNRIIISFAALIIIAVFYRLLPLPKGVYGFTPMFAMAIFGGAIFRDNKKLAFVLPLATMFISDCVFQILYNAGKSSIAGFYEGQLLNYILYAVTVCIGFFVKRINVKNILIASVAAPTLFYILSNFSVWLTTDFYPKTFAGLGQCYVAGLPFYFPWSLVSTIVYSGVLFGLFYGMRSFSAKSVAA